MDRFERTTDIIKEYYKYKNNKSNAEFVKTVCKYFDCIQEDEITGSDLNFLSLMANEAGVPQYYDLLLAKKKINEVESVGEISLGMLSSFFYDASLSVGEGEGKLHRFQKNILEQFSLDSQNRFVLTAPTSFGKTYLVYQILQKMNYKNVLLVFPTISLLTENFEKIKSISRFEKYKLHTLSEAEFDIEDYNIFVFTPERYLSFLDRNNDLLIDFTFIDEIYKIDNGYLIDDEISENERDVAYRLALEYACRNSSDIFLVGPYISIEKQVYENSFLKFCDINNFSILQFNEFEIVDKNYYRIIARGVYQVNGKIINIPNKKKKTLLTNVVKALSNPSENTIVYCGRKIDAEKYARYFLEDVECVQTFVEKYDTQDEIYEMFIRHLENKYDKEWIVILALKARIGIHHGLIPKYIQKEIINLFNDGQLLCLLSTTTITEGVNTPAKNMVITSLKKGRKELKQFDAKNIAGRAGRFGQHYSGRVIDIIDGFEEVLEGDSDSLKHKNYDKDIPKLDVDFQITEDIYLSGEEKNYKKELEKKVLELELPPEVMSKFKVVGPSNKIFLYQRMISLDDKEMQQIDKLVISTTASKGKRISWSGLQTVLNIIAPVITDSKLAAMIERRISTKTGEYSLLIFLLDAYLKNGFMGMVKYKVEKKGEKIDTAMRNVADTVYNTFKYQLVKYLGTFDILYRYILSKEKNCEMDDILGLTFLLQKLEYNATNDKAKIVSDYGVPYSVICKYENPDSQIELDEYERYIDSQVVRLIGD